MKSAIHLRFVALSWMSIFALLVASASGAENGGPCRPVTYERNSYVVCQFDLRHYTPKLFWKQPNGEPLWVSFKHTAKRRFRYRATSVRYEWRQAVSSDFAYQWVCMLRMDESLYEQIPRRGQ